MKKVALLFISMLALTCILVSCNDDIENEVKPDQFVGTWALDSKEDSYIIFDGFGGFELDIDYGIGSRIKGKGVYMKEGEKVDPIAKTVGEGCIALVLSEPMKKEYAFVHYVDADRANICFADTETAESSTYGDNAYPYFTYFDQQENSFGISYDEDWFFSLMNIDIDSKVLKMMSANHNAEAHESMTYECLVSDVELNLNNPLAYPNDATKWVVKLHNAEKFKVYYCKFTLSEDTLKLIVNEDGYDKDYILTR